MQSLLMQLSILKVLKLHHIMKNADMTEDGRKRNIVVDTMGNLLFVKVHSVTIHDTKSGIYDDKRL